MASDEEFRELWSAGWPVKELANQLGMSETAVQNWRDRLDLPSRKAAAREKAATGVALSMPTLGRVKTCQFIRDRGPWLGRTPDYCGMPVVPGTSWCVGCRMRVFDVHARPVRVPGYLIH